MSIPEPDPQRVATVVAEVVQRYHGDASCLVQLLREVQEALD